MIIKYLLIVPLALFFLYFIRNSGKTQIQAWKKILFALFLLFGIVAVLDPLIVDVLAKKIGIGRGADMLLYALTISFIFVVGNIYIKFKEISLRQDKIISKIALIEGDKNDR
jgi:hypothetical protein